MIGEGVADRPHGPDQVAVRDRKQGLAQAAHVDVDRPAPDVHVALPGGILQFFAGGDLLGMLEQVAQDLELDGTEVDITTTAARSEEHTSELQSLMRISYAV